MPYSHVIIVKPFQPNPRCKQFQWNLCGIHSTQTLKVPTKQDVVHQIIQKTNQNPPHTHQGPYLMMSRCTPKSKSKLDQGVLEYKRKTRESWERVKESSSSSKTGGVRWWREETGGKGGGRCSFNALFSRQPPWRDRLVAPHVPARQGGAQRPPRQQRSTDEATVGVSFCNLFWALAIFVILFNKGLKIKKSPWCSWLENVVLKTVTTGCGHMCGIGVGRSLAHACTRC